MPIASIEVRKAWAPGKQQSNIDSLHAAMVEALGWPRENT